MSETVYTIGYSTHSIDEVLKLFRRHGITAVADVRSQPYSRVNRQFNREYFRQILTTEGIAYVFLGKELGARTEDKNCYRDGRVEYDLLAQTDAFQDGLKRIKRGAQSYRIALMCAEKDPLDCHRGILVSRHLTEQGIHVIHILPDGALEEHEQAIKRLIDKLHLHQLHMFRPPDDIAKDAYRIQGNAIAYHSKSEVNATNTKEVVSGAA